MGRKEEIAQRSKEGNEIGEKADSEGEGKNGAKMEENEEGRRKARDSRHGEN